MKIFDHENLELYDIASRKNVMLNTVYLEFFPNSVR